MPPRDPETEFRRERFLDYCRARGWSHENNRWSVTDIATAIGKPINLVSNLLHGHGSFGAKIARSIETALQLERGFFDGFGDKEFLDVPRVDVQLSAGNGAMPHIEEVTGHLKFSRTFLRSCGVQASSARVVDVRGNSMEPTIKDGAVLLVSTNNREPAENQIFAMARPSEGLIVKRLVRLNGLWVARSDNRDFEDLPFGDGEPVTIIGRAIWMGARL